MKKLDFIYKIDGLKVQMVSDNYINNNGLYLGLIVQDTKESYCDITVNIKGLTSGTIALDCDFNYYAPARLKKAVLKYLNAHYMTSERAEFCEFPIYVIRDLGGVC